MSTSQPPTSVARHANPAENEDLAEDNSSPREKEPPAVQPEDREGSNDDWGEPPEHEYSPKSPPYSYVPPQPSQQHGISKPPQDGESSSEPEIVPPKKPSKKHRPLSYLSFEDVVDVDLCLMLDETYPCHEVQVMLDSHTL